MKTTFYVDGPEALLPSARPVAAALPVLLAIADVTVGLAGRYFLGGLNLVTYCLDAPRSGEGTGARAGLGRRRRGLA